MTLPDQRLRCGRVVDDVLAQVADGGGRKWDEHQQRCPYCQAALGEYERLWAPLFEIAAQKIRAPEHLLDNALRRIRGAVEHTDHGVIDSPLGRTRISARVVVVTARETATSVPGVRVALSRHLADSRTVAPDDRRAEVTVGLAGRSTAIEITLAADYGQDLIALAERVRREIAARVRALTDLETVAITVIIDDILT